MVEEDSAKGGISGQLQTKAKQNIPSKIRTAQSKKWISTNCTRPMRGLYN